MEGQEADFAKNWCSSIREASGLDDLKAQGVD